jgi:hypothetical protein
MPGAARRLTNRQHHSRNPTVRRPNRLRNRRVLSVAALFAIPRESGLHKFIQSFTPGLCLPFAGCVSRPHRQDAYTAPLLLHARRSDPDRPSGVSPNRRLRVGFRLVNNVATCSDAFNEAHFASGWCGHPSGLQHTLSTHIIGRTPIQRFTAIVRLCSQIPSTITAPLAAQDSIGVGG